MARTTDSSDHPSVWGCSVRGQTTLGCQTGRVEHQITTDAELTSLLGPPGPVAANKERPALHELDRAWLAATPFVVLATSDAAGNCDASPKGDPAGRLVHVIDDHTIAIAERPGNRRVDGYRNVLENPHVGLICVIPGRSDTLRINGRARLVTDAPWFGRLEVKGHRPILALVIEIDTVFHHCQKAFLRAGLWEPQGWHPEAVPRRAVLSRTFERPGASLEQLDDYYGAGYAEGIYR